MTFLLVAIYNLIIFGGTAYLVAIHGWSAWWFVLAVLISAHTATRNDR